MTASCGVLRPVTEYTEQAVSCSSGGSSSMLVFRFTPMPMMSLKLPPAETDSVRIPQSFFPPNCRSFGHFMSAPSPQTFLSARRTATAAVGVSVMQARKSAAGASSIERYTPPGGEAKLLPSLPRPPVCRPAATTVPGSA